MWIVTEDELKLRLRIQLIANRKASRRAIGSDYAADELADLIYERVLSGTVVLAPDMVSSQQRPGKFGVDEPHPHPGLVSPPPPDPALRFKL